MAETTKPPGVPTEKLKFSEKLGYGLGDAASNFYFQVFNIFLLYYYTDVFGLHPAAVGTMFIVTKAVDALSDPAMGLIADRTSSRWGKYRPYLVTVAVPYGLLGYAMFASPELSQTGRLIYAYVTYSLMMLAYTAINIPYSALMGVISPASDERVKVATYRFVCAYGAAWLIGTFVTPLKNILGGGDEAEGFRLTMMYFSVISIAMFWATFATTKERVQATVQKSDVKEDLKAVASNVPWIALFVSGVFALMQVAVRNGGILYFFKYYVGDDGTRLFWIFDSTAIFLSLGTFSLILGVVLTRFLTQRFEKQHLMIALTVLSTATSALFFFVSPDQYGLMLALNCIGNFIAGPLAPLGLRHERGLRRLRRMAQRPPHHSPDLLWRRFRRQDGPSRGCRPSRLHPGPVWLRRQPTTNRNRHSRHPPNVQPVPRRPLPVRRGGHPLLPPGSSQNRHH